MSIVRGQKLITVPKLKVVENSQVITQNDWVTLLEGNNITLVSVCHEMQTANEDLEFRWTIDGDIFTGAQAGAVAGTPYWLHLYSYGNTTTVLSNTSIYLACMRYSVVTGRSVKVEARKTTATGANQFQTAIIYQQVE